MATPEYQAQPFHPRGISIARLISSEFGTAEAEVRRQLDHAATEIELDGVVWKGEKRFIPRAALLGKTITIVAPERHWQMKYPEN